MAKKVIYQFGRKQYQVVDVDSEEQENVIKDLNRDFEKMDKREKRDNVRCTSIEELSEQGVELVSKELQPDEQMLLSEELSTLQQAMATLTPKQREILYLRFWEEKTLEEIAKLKDVHISTIAESLNSSIKKLKKFFNNF